jgi:deoxyhypusine synthase
LVYNGFPNEVPTITVTGVSDGFQNIALQTEQYRKDTSLLNPVVNDLEKKENMTIDFSVDMEADRRLTSFSSFLNRPDTKINEVYSPEVTDAMIDNGTTTATTTENNLSEDF